MKRTLGPVISFSIVVAIAVALAEYNKAADHGGTSSVSATTHSSAERR